MINLVRKSQFTGKENSMLLDTTQEKLDLFYNSHISERPLIQEIFPNLNNDEREFIISGVTPKEWNERFNII